MSDLIDTDDILAFLANKNTKKNDFIYSIEEEEWIDGEFSIDFQFNQKLKTC